MLFHQLPNHDITFEAALPEMFVDNRKGAYSYWDAAHSLSLDMSSLPNKSGFLYRFGLHVVVFADSGFVRQLVEWTLLALNREGVGEGWKGFVYALEAVYDKGSALEKMKRLNGYDDGNSISNMLWWIYSRDDDDEEQGELQVVKVVGSSA
ncbi:hypothetical protein LINPERPRIM_LOCUS1958, partial [Linum perenne]